MLYLYKISTIIDRGGAEPKIRAGAKWATEQGGAANLNQWTSKDCAAGIGDTLSFEQSDPVYVPSYCEPGSPTPRGSESETDDDESFRGACHVMLFPSLLTTARTFKRRERKLNPPPFLSSFSFLEGELVPVSAREGFERLSTFATGEPEQRINYAQKPEFTASTASTVFMTGEAASLPNSSPTKGVRMTVVLSPEEFASGLPPIKRRKSFGRSPFGARRSGRTPAATGGGTPKRGFFGFLTGRKPPPPLAGPMN
ncbi:hypothetical protein T492DRAFT_17567 [Pavlovales sp. CCMP2436]|nr:hypothetical protein T492DRAFT_17567 [Pavlovales sp. CCMP2436]